jgi:hypothetical protein
MLVMERRFKGIWGDHPRDSRLQDGGRGRRPATPLVVILIAAYLWGDE